jgi:acetyl esterase
MIDPELQSFLRMWQQAWSDTLGDAPVAARRVVLERISEQTREPLRPGFESTVEIVAGGSRQVRVRIFRPIAGPASPALIFMHGGAWMVGSPETHHQLAGSITEKTHQTVISVDYALAPEYPFPAAIEDCQTVVRWVFTNADALNIRQNAISVGGESSGANLAAAMALHFRGTAQQFRGQLLFYPPVDFTHSRPSFFENADGPLLTTASMINAMAVYVPNPTNRHNPLAAPLQAENHTDLPPAFITVAEHDPLRDDGLAYAEKLMAAGVPVQLHRGAGLIHGYLRALSYSAAARAVLDAACIWLTKIAQN